MTCEAKLHGWVTRIVRPILSLIPSSAASPETVDISADSSPPPPPTPRQPPPAELVGCVTQSRDDVKAWVRSNAGVLLRSGRGFNKEVYQELQAAVRPLTPSPPLNTVLILPDGYEEIMRGVFELFEEVA